MLRAKNIIRGGYKMKKVNVLIILLICFTFICGCSRSDKKDQERTVPTSEELCGIEETSSDMDMAFEKGLNTNNKEFSEKYIYMQDLYNGLSTLI